MSHVVIVGAGPAGASLAYLLSDRGVEVTLLERQHDFSREFRGEILMPSGIEAFKEMGLATQLESVPGHSQESVEVYMNGRHLFTQSLELGGSARGPRFLAVSQPALLEMLVSESAKSPSFRLRRGASMTKLVLEDARVLGVRARVDGGDETIWADLVIGADGRSSAVRRHLGLGAQRTSPPMDIVWCKVPCPEGWTGVHAYVGRGHLLVAYRTWDGSLQLGWVVLKGTFGELRSRGIEEWVEEMANHVSSDFAQHLRAHRDDVHKPFLLSTTSDHVEPWSNPGVMVIGDAAHTMSPVGGQGINIALRDAIVAANHLVPLLSGSAPDADELDAAMKTIEAERMREVRPIQAQQARPPKVLLSRSWWGEPVRRVAGALLRMPTVRRRAGGIASTFLHGVTDVRLMV